MAVDLEVGAVFNSFFGMQFLGLQLKLKQTKLEMGAALQVWGHLLHPCQHHP
jgi:hypothetical protein